MGLIEIFKNGTFAFNKYDKAICYKLPQDVKHGGEVTHLFSYQRALTLSLLN